MWKPQPRHECYQGNEGLRMLYRLAADTTTSPQRLTTWFAQAKCHGNCEDLYQWERADEVSWLSDLIDLICAQMLPATLKVCRLTDFTWNAPPQLILTVFTPAFKCEVEPLGCEIVFLIRWNYFTELSSNTSAFALCAVSDNIYVSWQVCINGQSLLYLLIQISSSLR